MVMFPIFQINGFTVQLKDSCCKEKVEYWRNVRTKKKNDSERNKAAPLAVGLRVHHGLQDFFRCGLLFGRHTQPKLDKFL